MTLALSDSAATRVNPDAIGDWHTDEGTLVKAARTDRQAFAALYDLYADRIYHYIARRVSSEPIAEDLASATWERALAAIERFEFRGTPFSAWLYRIAGNLIANHYRQDRAHPESELDSQRAVSAGLGALAERQEVRNALMRLSESDQELIGLCYFAGLTPAEIADVLGVSPAAIHKRLHRARERLRILLESGHA